MQFPRFQVTLRFNAWPPLGMTLHPGSFNITIIYHATNDRAVSQIPRVYKNLHPEGTLHTRRSEPVNHVSGQTKGNRLGGRKNSALQWNSKIRLIKKKLNLILITETTDWQTIAFFVQKFNSVKRNKIVYVIVETLSVYAVYLQFFSSVNFCSSRDTRTLFPEFRHSRYKFQHFSHLRKGDAENFFFEATPAFSQNSEPPKINLNLKSPAQRRY